MVDTRSRTGKKSDATGRSPDGSRRRRTPPRRISPARRGTIRLTVVLGCLVLVNCYVFLWRDSTSIPAVMQKARALDADAAAATPPAPAPAEVAAAAALPPSPPAAPTVVTGKVASGDTVGKILKKNGLTASETDEVLRALSDVFDFKSLQPGQAFAIERDPAGLVQSFQIEVSKIKTVRVERDDAGAMVGVADRAETRTELEEVGGTINSSLWFSIKAAGEDPSLVAFFVDVFAYDLDFYVDQHAGDEFRVLVEKEYVGQEFLRYGRILAAEYAGKAGTFRAFYFKPDGAKVGRYYDEKGQSVEKSILKTPLKYTRISSKFNPKRMHPVLHVVRGHYGVDYAAPTGTPVWAAANGTIIGRGFSRGPGNMVTIRHDNGLVTKYMHLSKFAKGQKVGQRIEAKTVIGYVGSTGLSTGPHLHFSVLKNGAHVDPLKLAPTRGAGVAKKDLPAFRREIDGRVAQLRGIDVRAVAVAAEPDPDDAALPGADEAGVGGPDEPAAP